MDVRTRFEFLDVKHFKHKTIKFALVLFQYLEMDVTNMKNGKRRTGNGERGTGNGERGTGNGKRGTGNGERRTRNGQRGTGNGERASGN